jgi:dienelactone hydrolase
MPAHRPPRQPLPLPPDTAEYYAYPRRPQEAAITHVRDQSRYREFLVQFPLSAEGFEPTEPVVEFEWLESKAPGKRPVIVVNPILGGDYPLERGVARFFASRGFHAVLVHRKTLKISPEHPPSRIELLLRQGVFRIRQIVDWLEQHERVDATRLGCFGISMGGIATSMMAAVEPRFGAYVVALAGGSIPEIMTTSKDKLLTKPLKRYLERNQLTPEQLKALLDAEMRSDPMRLAPYVDPKEVLMFIALFDRTIGRKHAFQLREALGSPKTILLPFGHYTSYACLPYFKRASLGYFRKALHVDDEP